jgi:hypothetical protein
MQNVLWIKKKEKEKMKEVQIKQSETERDLYILDKFQNIYTPFLCYNVP